MPRVNDATEQLLGTSYIFGGIGANLFVGDTGWHADLLIRILIYHPARAMTGSNWKGAEMCWRYRPEDYAAIHFHDDDIYDFNWETDFSLSLPANMTSRIYAVNLTCGKYQDSIRLLVCPPRNRRRPDICLLISTSTYVVYRNHARPDYGTELLGRTTEQNGMLTPGTQPNFRTTACLPIICMVTAAGFAMLPTNAH